MTYEHSIEELYAQRVRLPVWGTLLIYGLGACVVCAANAAIGGVAAYDWGDMPFAFAYALASARGSAILLLLGGLAILVVPSMRREGPIMKVLGIILVATMVLSYVQSKEPSARSVFESELGFVPDENVVEVRSFVSSAEFEEPTIGIQFRVNDESLARMIQALQLGEAEPFTMSVAAIRRRAEAINPVPAWFANDASEVRMKLWSRADATSDVSIFLDTERKIVYLIDQRI